LAGFLDIDVGLLCITTMSIHSSSTPIWAHFHFSTAKTLDFLHQKSSMYSTRVSLAQCSTIRLQSPNQSLEIPRHEISDPPFEHFRSGLLKIRQAMPGRYVTQIRRACTLVEGAREMTVLFTLRPVSPRVEGDQEEAIILQELSG
jgi:hypothetical protein